MQRQTTTALPSVGGTIASERGVLIDLRPMQRVSGGLNRVERQILAHVGRLREQAGPRPAIVGYRSALLPPVAASVTDLCDRVVGAPEAGLDGGVLLLPDPTRFFPALTRCRTGARLRVAAFVDNRIVLPASAPRGEPIDVVFALGDGEEEPSPALSRYWPRASIQCLAWAQLPAASRPSDVVEDLAIAQLTEGERPFVVIAPEFGERALRAIAVARANLLRERGQAPRLLKLRERALPPRLAPLPMMMATSIVQFGDILELPAFSDEGVAALFRAAAAVLIERDSPYAQYGAEDVKSAGGRFVALSSSQLISADGDAARERLVDALSDAAAQSAGYSACTPPVSTLPWDLLLTDPEHTRAARPQLALVAPYPKSEFGVSVYTRDTGAALSKIADVDLLTIKNVAERDQIGLRSIRHPDRTGDPLRYDCIFHILYNHPDAAPAYLALMENGGAVILHDAHLLAMLNFVHGPPWLRSYMETVLDRRITDREFDRWVYEMRDMPSSFLDTVVEKAAPLIVHSPTARDFLQAAYGIRPIYVPVAIQHRVPAQALAPDQRLAAKWRCGMDPGRRAIGTFGAVQALKGDKQLIYSVRHLVDWGYDIEFFYVGHLSSDRRTALEDAATYFDLSDRIRFVSDVAEDVYMDHLVAMDVGVQLRTIGMGQLSGALLDCVAASLPTITSAGLAESIEAPPFVRAIRDASSPLLVADGIARLLEDLPSVPRPHASWADYVEDHSFARYAERLVEAVSARSTAPSRNMATERQDR